MYLFAILINSPKEYGFITGFTLLRYKVPLSAPPPLGFLLIGLGKSGKFTPLTKLLIPSTPPSIPSTTDLVMSTRSPLGPTFLSPRPPAPYDELGELYDELDGVKEGFVFTLNTLGFGGLYPLVVMKTSSLEGTKAKLRPGMKNHHLMID